MLEAPEQFQEDIRPLLCSFSILLAVKTDLQRVHCDCRRILHQKPFKVLNCARRSRVADLVLLVTALSKILPRKVILSALLNLHCAII